ncbi:uncharacterized protein LOC131304807 [Rhododendron vialii]|uniref:uncharacterized protein LOC131304807 n=1 Tax=Rhododendron vialii TaxID=182163 RepID=UPI00265D7B7B|nr:uncharacterized protein LOC131304807 [Rhododendron vialii]
MKFSRLTSPPTSRQTEKYNSLCIMYSLSLSLDSTPSAKMATSRSRSFFQDISSRELDGFRVRKRPYPDNELSNFTRIGAVTTEHSGVFSPPMALSFCKTSKNSHILAVTDEDGYISLYNTRLKFASSSTCQENTEKSRVCQWVAHQNAIFDICWIKEDTRIITASGDQSVKVWDAQEKKCIATLMGHTGSVKSTCSHPTNPDLIVSGARDGLLMLWDLRCSNSKNGRPSPIPLVEVRDAHKSPHGKRVRRGKAAPTSVTSVLYLKDEISIASAGAVDSVVKFWDVRNLKVPVIQACPNSEVAIEKKRRLHGISSLSQDLNGVFIAASCMDNRIYLYNVLQLEKGPVKSFSGCFIESFFIKSALSPDASHILGGSSDGNAYIWQVNKPQADPITMKGHNGEVTAVDWCQSEVGKIATSSDDFTVCFWNVKNSCYSNTRSPSSIRRRVMAPPSMECRKLFMDEELVEHQKGSNSTNSNTMPQLGTPKCQKKNFPSELYSEETLEKTPEALVNSPSSVLSPPSSLKRKTIRDYFIAPS